MVFTIGTLVRNVVIINALGLLAPFGWRWLYWLVLVVNVGHGAGVVLAPFGAGPIPPEVLRATVDVHGWAGLPPSLCTDGGAVVLVVVLLVFRRRWARDTKSQECLIDSEVAG